MPRTLIEDRYIYTGKLYPVFTNTNILADGGFESGITGWSAVSSATLAHQSGIQDNPGGKCLKITCANATSGAKYQEDSVASGTKRRFRVRVKPGNAQAVGKFVQLKIQSEVDSSFQDTVMVKLEADVWKEIWCTWQLPNTGNVTYHVYGYDTANNDVFFVDTAFIDSYTLPTTTTSGRKILYNNRAVFLRGSNYTNVLSTGSVPSTFAGEPKQLRYDIEKLAENGYNMIRIYDDNYNRNTHGRGFDVCLQFGIGVMVLDYAHPGTQDITVATGGTNRTNYVNNFKTTVGNIKDHPAVIAWGWGNEPNYGLGGSNTASDLQTLIEAICAGGKTISTRCVNYISYGGIPSTGFDATVPSLDVFGYTYYGGGQAQAYRGSSLPSNFDTFTAISTQKPTLLTEIGCGAYASGMTNGDQAGQATTDLLLTQQSEALYAVLSGITIFQSTDDRSATGDTFWFGKEEPLASGSAQFRTNRQAFTDLATYFQSHRVPQTV